jgi:hypothetical protein
MVQMFREEEDAWISLFPMNTSHCTCISDSWTHMSNVIVIISE